MSDNRDESPVRPAVIDLDAEDVVADTDEVKAQPAEEGKARPPAFSKLWWPGAALMMGLIAGGWFYRDVLSSYFPSSGLNNATARIATLEQQTRVIADQSAAAAAKSADEVAKLGQQLEGSGQLTRQAQATAAEFGKRLDELDAKLAAVTDDFRRLKPVPAPVIAGREPAANPEALDALARRVAELEKEVASLKAGAPPSDRSSRATVLSQSFADLKAKIAAGVSYKDELEKVQRLAPAAAGLDALNAHGAEGLPTAQALAEEMEKLIPSLPKPEGVQPEAGGYLDGFWNAISGVITIRRIGEADWPGLAARAAEVARNGDLPGAIELIDKAEGVHPAVIDQWRERAKGRLAVEAALIDTSQSVMRQLSSMSSAP